MTEAQRRQPDRSADEIERELAEIESTSVFGRPMESFERLTHSHVTRGVWRVRAGGERAVLKVLPRPSQGTPESDSAAVRYWLRELFAYDGGIPEPYPAAGLRGPRLLARFERPDGDVALWLEDVEGLPAAEWDDAAFAETAERLGRAQGAFLAGTPLPDAPWHCRGFLRQYLAAPRPLVDAALLDADEAWARPPIARTFGPELRDGLVRLYRDRAVFLDWLDAVPRTFAHLDFWPANLFARPNETVAIDWSFCGIAAVGEDIGNLVPDSVFDMLHPPSALDAIAGASWGGYLRGLRAAGWAGDERPIRLGLTASAVKYAWIAAATLARAAAETPTQPIYGGAEVEADRLFEVRAAIMTFLLGWADEARAIARSLGLD